jgi:hypothetical protein
MSSKNKKIMLVVGILGLLITGAVGLFFWTHEKVEKEVREAPSGEAKRNPYLALERLMGRFEHNTQTLRKLSEPDDTFTTIILTDQGYDFSPEQVEAWATWVSEGGHLVLPQPYGEANENTAPLLARLGFSPGSSSFSLADLEFPDSDLADSDLADSDAEEAESEDSDSALSQDSTLYEQEWPEDAEDHSFTFGESVGVDQHLYWVAEDADWLARSDETSVFAASRRHDTGRVTLLGDSSVLSNDFIGEGEHATLAVRVAELGRGYEVEWRNITIVLYGKRQSWMLYVLGYTWPFVVIVVVALLLAIRAGRNRFGPVLADPPPERRSRSEHIDAVGRFLWQHGSVASLVEATQQALLDELEHRRPALAYMAIADRDEMIAEELGISYNEARELFLKPSGNRDAQSFTEQIRKLEQHRRKL